MNNKMKPFLVSEDMTIKSVMKKMGQTGERVLFVVKQNNQLLGSVTDGDIRRSILSNGDLTVKVDKIYNKDPIVIKSDYGLEDVKQLMLEHKIQGIPVVDDNGVLQKVLLWENIFNDISDKQKIRSKIDIPALIMAGGKGSRLDPFTKILPKPLIPIGDKAILEVIIEKLHEFGIKDFYVSTHHKARLINAYFEELNKTYRIDFIEELTPLGTAGVLRLLGDRVKDNLLLSNCDIIIDADYSEIVKLHETEDNDITIVGSFRHFVIPYGVCEIQNGGSLININEKPEYDLLVNTGMYIINRRTFKYIPKNRVFHATDLINKVKDGGGKVGIFPIDEKSWIDVGQWEEYNKVTENLKTFGKF